MWQSNNCIKQNKIIRTIHNALNCGSVKTGVKRICYSHNINGLITFIEEIQSENIVFRNWEARFVFHIILLSL